MHNERIYSAPSLSEVIKQLLIYHPTGVLTIWLAGGIRQDDARITIERGRIIHIYWRSYKEDANEHILAWLNSWGEIHFSFQSTVSHLQLPSPRSSQAVQPEQPIQPARPTPPIHRETPMQPTVPQRRPAVTQPLHTINRTAYNAAGNMGQVQENRESYGEYGRTRERPPAQLLQRREEHGNTSANSDPLTPIALETIVASHTQNGRDYPAAHLPRRDRTIFLLTNGQRTVVDLAQLTNRSLEEVYTTLLRLKDSGLITIETRVKGRGEAGPKASV